MNALSSIFLILLSLSSILSQCPPQPSDPSVSGQGGTFFINHTKAEQPQSGRVKDAIVSTVQNNVQCSDIIIRALNFSWGDGVTWGTVVDFVIPKATPQILQAYNASVSVSLPLLNAMTNAVRTAFPPNNAADVSSITAIPYSAISQFLINGKATTTRQSQNGQIIAIGQSTGNSSQVAAQPCVLSGWSDCDGCKRDKSQIVTRSIIKPAVGGGSCEATQMLIHCNRKCLTDWQIGLIALACFLFLVFICICLYCVCARRRPVHDPAKERAQQKAIELGTPPPVDEKIDVDVVDPVRPSTAVDEPANFHRASSETGTGPRPTAMFHDDEEEPAETKPTPPEEEAKSTEPEPVPVAAPPAGAPRANVVRVHL